MGSCILLVVSNRKERELLADWLGRAYSVEAPDPQTYPVSKAIFDQAFDLVVLDGPAFEQQRNLIRLLRENDKDVFMPILLVTSRQSVRHATENLWRLIDEVVLKPIEKAELYARVEILLRAHYYSLRLQENYYGLAEIAPVGIVVFDRVGVIRYANEYAERMFVGRDSKMVGRSVEEPWNFMNPAGYRLSQAERPFARIVATGGPIHDFQVAYRNDDGHEYRLSVSGVPIPSTANDVDRVLMVVKDITQQVRQADELWRARDRAEEMSRLKTAFLANMSHEIRTPLTGILSSAEILSYETEGELQEIANLITISAERLRRTLEAVLDLSQLESETWQLSRTDVDLTDVIRRVAAEYRQPAAERGITITIEQPDHCQVSYDRLALDRIVDSLVSNAVKFSRDAPVFIRAECAEDHFEIEVKDEGVGISREFLPHIFEEFKQESQGTTRNFEGSGLGLTIAKRLVTLMGGRIQVESTKGDGSTFRVVLPARHDEDISEETEPPMRTAAMDPRRARTEAQEVYFQTFERNPFPCLIVDAETLEIQRSNSAVRFYGYSDEDLVGTRFSDVCMMSEDLQLEPQDEPGWSRWNVRTRDGSYRPALAIYYAFETQGRRLVVFHLLDDEPVPGATFVRAERLRQLQLLQSFSSRISAAADLPSLYRTVDVTVREAFADVEALGLWSYDSRLDRLRLAAGSGPRDEEELIAFSEFPEFRKFIELKDTHIEETSAGPLSELFASSRTFGHARSVIVVPLRSAGELMALLVLAGSRVDHHSNYVEQRMMEAFAGLAALVIQRVRRLEHLREASRLLVDVQEAERRAISQDVHDEIGGLLNSLRLVLHMAVTDETSFTADINEAVQIVDEVIGHIRDLSFRLSPHMLADLGLIPTVRSYAKRFTARTRIPVQLQLDVDKDRRYAGDVESVAFRVIQESLTNASKHAAASSIQIQIREECEALLLHVLDDGAGFDPEDIPREAGGMGLRGLEERIGMIGGAFDVASSTGGGTRVSATLPIPATI